MYILMSGKSAVINIKGNKYVVTIKDNKLNKIQSIPESNIMDINDGREKILMNPEDFLTEDKELLLFDIDYETLYKNSTIKTYQKLSIGENINYGYIMLNEKLNNLTLNFNEINIYAILIPMNYKGTVIANKTTYNLSGNGNDSYYVIELDGKKYYSIQNK